MLACYFVQQQPEKRTSDTRLCCSGSVYWPESLSIGQDRSSGASNYQLLQMRLAEHAYHFQDGFLLDLLDVVQAMCFLD